MPEPFMFRPFAPNVSARIEKKYTCCKCNQLTPAVDMVYTGDFREERDPDKFACKKHEQKKISNDIPRSS